MSDDLIDGFGATYFKRELGKNWMSILDITRREMLAACGSLALSTGLNPSSVIAQDATRKDLIFRTTDPRNGEPELSKLVESWLTPTSLFYVRSHAPNPVIDPSSFKLEVTGMVRRPMSLSLDDLKRFATKTTTATLTCAGNRRIEFNKEGKVGGVQWEAGAIGNATWAGVSLADVLKFVEVAGDAKHVWFEGLDEISKGGDTIPFGGSIPMQKAIVGQGAAAPLLAHTMNGAPLTPDHGFPLRTVVPGYIGARSVKWLGKIVVSDRPSPNHYVATAYKLVKKTDPLDWMESGPIYRYPVNAAICSPALHSTVAAGKVEVTGYVLPSGRPACKPKSVLVSSDSGKNWVKAELTGNDAEFCWQLWRTQINVTDSTRQLIVRTTDSSGSFMPARVPWNAKGYLQNSWYKLPIKVG